MSKSNNKIRVLVVEPHKRPVVREIENDLKTLQSVVGGMIEALYPFEEHVGIICNEEGKILGLPLNRAMRDEEGKIYDVIAGTFIVAGLTEEDFGSLDNELIEHFSLRFRQPEMFVYENGVLKVIPYGGTYDA